MTAKTKKTTTVSMILDKSGSMSSVKEATISGFNEYIATLKEKGGDYSISLTLFDNQVFEPQKEVSIDKIKPLNFKTYVPGGSTALYDAVCTNLTAIKDSLKGKATGLVVIITDGEENSSREYNQDSMKALIKEMEDSGKWTFAYLGANQDAYAVAQKYGFSNMGAVADFNATGTGMKSMMRGMANATASYSAASLGSNYDNKTYTFLSQEEKDVIKNA